MNILLQWLVCAVALILVAKIVPGVWVKSFGSALFAALVIGLINALIRPLLILLTIPITILTLGLFLFVINALLFLLAGRLLSGFKVRDFWSALGGSIVYSILVYLADRLLG
jgi:putative membrane protein